MIALGLIGLPLVTAGAVWPERVRRAAPPLMVATSLVVALGAVLTAVWPSVFPIAIRSLAGDATSRLFLALIDVLFLGIAAHVANRARRDEGFQARARRFAMFALPFLGCANLAVLSDSVRLGWCALELTTLLAAPLVADDGAPEKMQASWRYILFSSVGLAIVLVGSICLQRGLGDHGALTYTDLAGAGAALQTPWARLGIALMIAGYGVKLGLVPMNTWLPETYAAAPAPVTALLGAVQFNVALVGLIRVVQFSRGVDGSFVADELLWLGMLSMAVSGFGIVTTRDYVRLLGYASINHAGVIAIGLALGGVASYGMILYVVSNAFIKAILFLTAGRVRDHFQTSDAGQVHGLVKAMPFSGAFLMVGTFALLGLPPFGSFLGELMILSAIVESGRVVLLFPFCAMLAVSFVATGRTLFPMIWGETSVAPRPAARGSFVVDALPKAAFLVALVLLGVYIPAPANALLRDVAVTLGGR